jgi:hypothetical protein
MQLVQILAMGVFNSCGKTNNTDMLSGVIDIKTCQVSLEKLPEDTCWSMSKTSMATWLPPLTTASSKRRAVGNEETTD